jgi:hypothetical protein
LKMPIAIVLKLYHRNGRATAAVPLAVANCLL